MRVFFLRTFFGLGFFLVPFVASAASVDVGFTGGTQDIFFSGSSLVAGNPVRIYAQVHNFGDVDVFAQVVFYQGGGLIGEAQPVSIRAKGLSDEVYVDWVIPQGSFNVRVEVKAQNPADQNPSNDVALTSLISPEPPPPPPPPPASTAGLAASVSGGGKVASPPVTKAAVEKKSGAATVAGQKVSSALAPPLAPTVKGERTPEATTIAVDDVEEVAVNDLLKVNIDVREQAWNTFLFSADANRIDATSYEWSFGDGKTARGQEVTHRYRFAGRYVVSVVAIAPSGERAQEKVTLDISFWHLSNWQLLLLLAFLFGFIALLLAVTRRTKGEEVVHEHASVEDGELPPVLLTEDNVATTIPVVKKKSKSRPRKKKVVAEPLLEKSVEPPPPSDEPPLLE